VVISGTGSRAGPGLGDLGFEVGDAAAEVGAGRLEAFVEGAVVGGELADALLEGGDPLNGFLGPFGFQVADLAEEFADAGALGEDLSVGGLEGVLGVQGPLVLGRLALLVLVGEQLGPALAGLGHGRGDCGPGFGVVVEEGAGDVRAAGDGGDADLGLLAAEPGDGLTDASEGGVGAVSAGRESGGRAGIGDGGGHARSCSSVVVSSWSCSS
jgi:hypothetical protein